MCDDYSAMTNEASNIDGKVAAVTAAQNFSVT